MVWNKGRKIAVGLLLLALIAAGVLRGNAAVAAADARGANRTLVIDAGHGGFDGGAVGFSGTQEKDINLSIASRVQVLAAFFGVQTAMTRTDENALGYDPSASVRENKIADIKMREQTVAAFADPVFVSVHLNKFSDAQYHGAQVFYSKNHAGGRALAECLQNALVAGVDPQNRRQAKQAEDTIYLMKQLSCPAVIVECGFLSNPEEAVRLTEENYQKQLAACIVCGYLRYEAGA